MTRAPHTGPTPPRARTHTAASQRTSANKGARHSTTTQRRSSSTHGREAYSNTAPQLVTQTLQQPSKNKSSCSIRSTRPASHPPKNQEPQDECAQAQQAQDTPQTNKGKGVLQTRCLLHTPPRPSPRKPPPALAPPHCSSLECTSPGSAQQAPRQGPLNPKGRRAHSMRSTHHITHTTITCKSQRCHPSATSGVNKKVQQ